MKLFILFLGLIVSILLETTVVDLPFVLLWLLLFVVFTREEWVFIVAVLSGFILDSLYVTTFGMHALFFAVFCLLLFLYEQKFELQSISFVAVMSCIGSVVYLLLFGSSNFLLQVLFSSCLVVALFLPLSIFYKNHVRTPLASEFS